MRKMMLGFLLFAGGCAATTTSPTYWSGSDMPHVTSAETAAAEQRSEQVRAEREEAERAIDYRVRRLAWKRWYEAFLADGDSVREAEDNASTITGVFPPIKEP